MSYVVPFDTLEMAMALRQEAGFDQKQAEGTAKVLSHLLAADLVTKADLAEFKREARETKLDLYAKIAEIQVYLEAKIKPRSLRLKLKSLNGHLVLSLLRPVLTSPPSA